MRVSRRNDDQEPQYRPVRVVADPVQETLNLRVRELPTDKR